MVSFRFSNAENQQQQQARIAYSLQISHQQLTGILFSSYFDSRILSNTFVYIFSKLTPSITSSSASVPLHPNNHCNIIPLQKPNQIPHFLVVHLLLHFLLSNVKPFIFLFCYRILLCVEFHAKGCFGYIHLRFD